MDINLKELQGKPKLLHSEAAEAGAKLLMERMANQDMVLEVLPNNFAQFTGVLEEQDYVSYCSFLRSVNGNRVIRMLEESDEE